jgi:nucleotide-binding universal stress UspA family protein
VVALVAFRRHLAHPAAAAVEDRTGEQPPAGVLLALPATCSQAVPVVETAARVARARDTGVLVAHVRETRPAIEDAVDLERPEQARAALRELVGELEREGIPASSVVLHVTGHHDDAARALIDLAGHAQASAVVVGRPSRRPSEPGAPSVATVLSEEAPCDVVVVAEREPVPA